MFQINKQIILCNFNCYTGSYNTIINTMGGNALKTIKTQRFPKHLYELIKMAILQTLQMIGIPAVSLRETPEKEDFGDLDIVIDFSQITDPRAFISKHFHPNEIVHNGPTYSFDFKLNPETPPFQIDFHSDSDLKMAQFYSSFGDLGSILGRLMNHYEIKYGMKGLWLNIAENNKHTAIGTIMLTSNPLEICQFLDFDYAHWLHGFQTKDELFHWITNSHWFTPQPFTYFNSQDRKRMRPLYLEFLKFIGITPIGLEGFDASSSSSSSLPHLVYINKQGVAIDYFKKQKELDQLKETYQKQQIIKTKLNGNILMKLGVTQMEIGSVMKFLKSQLSDDWLFQTPESDVLLRIQELLQKK